jgi:formaldehyde-activating enzyme involved in methanogenesis
MMEQEYKVLKKYGDFKKGDVLTPSEAFEGSEEEIAKAVQEAIDGGFIVEVVPEDSDDDAKVSGDVAVVVWNGNRREYSNEIHGKDFAKLAKMFADKIGGSIE